MADRKQIPRQTIGNLIPPLDDYVYFESPQIFSFRPTADEYDLVNAGWLMDASMLVYGSETFIHERVARLADELPSADVQIVSGTSTQALLLQTDQFAIVAFRGTRIEVLPDFLAWLDSGQSANETNPEPSGKWAFLNWRDVVSDSKLAIGPDGIHVGFRKAFDQPDVWKDILAQLATLADRPIWFTGHSLGAALATIAAARYSAVEPVQGLYTFGSPRVGNQDFVQTVPRGALRFVNNNDLVPRLPPPIGGYEHAGQLKFICPNGPIENDDIWRDPMTNRVRTAVSTLNRLLPEGWRKGMANPREFLERLRNLDIELPESNVSDHAPINYACKIWNAIGEPGT